MSRKKAKRDYEEDIEYLNQKIKRLKKKMQKNKCSTAESDAEDGGTRQASPVEEIVPDWVNDLREQAAPELEQSQKISQPTEIEQQVEKPTDTVNIVETGQEKTAEEEELDSEILEILGEDPSETIKYGPEIRQELACRLQHIATKGISKELRKQLVDKYPVPKNCQLIDAPKVNPEVKAAIPESIAKRDKGIEAKQKQLACAISCLSESISLLLNTKDKDNKLLKGLMDAARLLCDIQHGDSVTRRNFILFTLKKELKEHLSLTEIDSMLFSTKLADILKSAKAVNKSGIELKADQGNKQVAIANKKDKPGVTPRHLNQRAAPAATRRPAGAANRGYPAPRAPPLPTQPGRSYKTSSHRAPPTASHRRTQ